ncbi:MAG TPA: HAD family hydrolase [Sphingomicrobium sp.]|nr:HAD family hydrolase [Sphingomicrobium sp.]
MTSREADAPGLYSRRLSTTNFQGKPCLFLDRDGVVVEETNYLHRTEDVILIGGVPQAIAKTNALGIPVVLVTNQAGIGRGYYNWQQFELVQQHILDAFGSFGAKCDMVLACAYHKDAIAPYDVGDHSWRKPAPGMLLEAAKVLGIDLTRSHIIGDTLPDLAAGARAGLRGGTLVLTGHGKRAWNKSEADFSRYLTAGSFIPRVARNAAEAIENWLAELAPKTSAA